jgi:hypothetical protein
VHAVHADDPAESPRRATSRTNAAISAMHVAVATLQARLLAFLHSSGTNAPFRTRQTAGPAEPELVETQLMISSQSVGSVWGVRIVRTQVGLEKFLAFLLAAFLK